MSWHGGQEAEEGALGSVSHSHRSGFGEPRRGRPRAEAREVRAEAKKGRRPADKDFTFCSSVRDLKPCPPRNVQLLKFFKKWVGMA